MGDPNQAFDPTAPPNPPSWTPTKPPPPPSSSSRPRPSSPSSTSSPLSPGHLLLCPRRHAPKLTDVDGREAAELGRYLRLLSRALVRTTGVNDWNVVQNNGAAAAQVVNHVHYHLIPRPEIRASGKLRESFTMFGRGVRSELDDDEGAALAAKLREAIREVLEEENSKSKL
ncbi:HIT domain-containing protein [Apiospora rasikravindrae]|uniref:HIT domain-containing protein n=1 Tax=Apiospora rasikravindrae TaxID=990691 RepID=A0ABR1SFN1_9PEZI